MAGEAGFGEDADKIVVSWVFTAVEFFLITNGRLPI